MAKIGSAEGLYRGYAHGRYKIRGGFGRRDSWGSLDAQNCAGRGFVGCHRQSGDSSARCEHAAMEEGPAVPEEGIEKIGRAGACRSDFRVLFPGGATTAAGAS